MSGRTSCHLDKMSGTDFGLAESLQLMACMYRESSFVQKTLYPAFVAQSRFQKFYPPSGDRFNPGALAPEASAVTTALCALWRFSTD